MKALSKSLEAWVSGDPVSVVVPHPRGPGFYSGEFVGWIRDERGDVQAVVRLEGRTSSWLDIYHPSRLNKRIV